MVVPHSPRQTSSTPKKIQSLEKRQAQYCKVISFNTLEELNTEAFKLISAHTCRRGIPGSFQIKIQKFVGKRPHGQSCHADIFEQYFFVLDESDRRMKFVRSTRQFAKLSMCRNHIGRFGKSLAAQDERLVGTERETAALRFCDHTRFLPRQMDGNDARCLHRGPGLKPPLVEIGGAHFKWNTGTFEQDLPHLAARSQHQRLSRAPQCRHDARCLRRSAR